MLGLWVSQTYLKNSGGVGKTGESLVSLQEEYGLVRTKDFTGAFLKYIFLCVPSSLSVCLICSPLWFLIPASIVGLRLLFTNFLFQSFCKIQFLLILSDFSFVLASCWHSSLIPCSGFLVALLSLLLASILSVSWLPFSVLFSLLPAGLVLPSLQFWNGHFHFLPLGCLSLGNVPWQLHCFWVWCRNLRAEVHLQERPAHPQVYL